MAFDLSTAKPVDESESPPSGGKIDLTKIQIEPRKGGFDLSTARPVEDGGADAQPVTAGGQSPPPGAAAAIPVAPDHEPWYGYPLRDIGHALWSEAHGLADAPVAVAQAAAHLSPAVPSGRLDVAHPEKNRPVAQTIDDFVNKREQSIAVERAEDGREGFDAYRLAGNVMNPANYLVPESKSLNVLARVGRSGVQGAVAGLQQPVAGGDQEHFLLSKAEQGAIGYGAGVVLHPVAGLIRRAAAPIVKPIFNFIKGIKGDAVAQQAAAKEILRRVSQDGVKTQDILDALNLAPGKPLNLTDLGGENVKALAGKISRLPGQGREIIAKALNDRDLDAGLRLATDVNTGIKSGSSHVAAKALSEARAAQAAPLYEEAFKHKGNQNIASPEIDGILATPAGTKALKQAATKMQNDMTLAGKPDPELLEQAKEAGQYIPFKGGVASGLKLRTLDYVKRSLDDQIGAAFRAGENDEARILSGLKKKLVSALDAADSTATPARAALPGKVGQRAGSPAKDAVPGAYQRARAAYSGASQSMEALEAGQKFLSQSPEEIVDHVAGLSDGDKEFFKMGAAATLRARVAKAGPGGDESSKVMNSAYTQQQLRPLFGSDQEFNNFINAVKAEKTMFDTRRQVLGGPDTARRIAEDQSPENAAYDSMAAAGLHGVRGNYWSALKKGKEALDNFGRLGDAAQHAEMARILTTPLRGSGLNFLQSVQQGGGAGSAARNLLAPGVGGAPAAISAAPAAAGVAPLLNTPAPQRAAAGMLPEAAMAQLRQEMGDGLINKMAAGGHLNIVKSAADLPEDVAPGLKQKAVADPSIKGFYNGDGRSFLIADRHTPDSIRGAFLHEVGEHHSLGEMMGTDKYSTYLGNLAKSAHPEIKAAADHVEKFYPELKKNNPMFWREVSAHLAETAPENSPWWKDMYQTVRNWATKSGVKLNLTPQDVRTLVKQGLKNQAKADVRGAPSLQRGEPVEGRAPAFYSAIERNLQDKPGLPSKADAQRWSEWLDGAQRRGEIKKEERDWTGIDEWLKTHPGQVTRDQIRKFAEESRVQLKDATPAMGEDAHGVAGMVEQIYDDLFDRRFSKEEWKEIFKDEHPYPRSMDAQREAVEQMSMDPDSKGWVAIDAYAGDRFNADGGRESQGGGRYAEYQLPGGTNYREHVLTLPVKEHPDFPNPNDPMHPGRSKAYNSPHWDEPNIIAHVRTNDRIMDGKKDLHVEEVQSDWHQAGRDSGYKGQPLDTSGWEAVRTSGNAGSNDSLPYKIMNGDKEAIPNVIYSHNAKDALEAGISHADRMRVPDAPFKKTWDLLAMKQMIRRGAEEGYDRISWTPGAEQNARYAGRGAEEEAGMKKFYDEIMPKKVADYIKKWGGKIETGEIEVSGPNRHEGPPRKGDETRKVKVQYFDITPEMRKAALLGQPMFQKGSKAASAPAGDRGVNMLRQMVKAENKPAVSATPNQLKRIVRASTAIPLASSQQSSAQ